MSVPCLTLRKELLSFASTRQLNFQLHKHDIAPAKSSPVLLYSTRHRLVIMCIRADVHSMQYILPCAMYILSRLHKPLWPLSYGFDRPWFLYRRPLHRTSFCVRRTHSTIGVLRFNNKNIVPCFNCSLSSGHELVVRRLPDKLKDPWGIRLKPFVNAICSMEGANHLCSKAVRKIPKLYIYITKFWKNSNNHWWDIHLC